MDLQQDIQWIQSELVKVTDPDLISVFKSLLKYNEKKEETQDWWDHIGESEREDIEEGIKQADNGDVISHADVMKSYIRWLQK